LDFTIASTLSGGNDNYHFAEVKDKNISDKRLPFRKIVWYFPGTDLFDNNLLIGQLSLEMLG